MDKEDSRIIYDQYWQHARHIENESLAFASFYSIIVAGSFIFFNIDSGKQSTNVMIFVLFLSIFGFLFNYNLRIPFIKFVLKAEMIAINELEMKNEYRRFFEKDGGLFGKIIDTYDIFALFYISVITFSFYSILTNVYSIAICIPFGVFHLYQRRKLSNIKKEIDGLISS